MGGEKKSSSFHPETALLVRAALGLPTLGWVPGFRISRLPRPHGSVVPGGFMSLRGSILLKRASG